MADAFASSKRIFLLGPSHHAYLPGCALTRCEAYETPLGSLTIDLETIAQLHKTKAFEKMSLSTDEAEHSLELHLPHIYRMLQRYVVHELMFHLNGVYALQI